MTTRAGARVSADVWFRCYGVTPVSDYLAGTLAAARDADGFVAVNELVPGQDRVFALGDVSGADHKMAGAAGRQAAVAAGNIRASSRAGARSPPTSRTRPASSCPSARPAARASARARTS